VGLLWGITLRFLLTFVVGGECKPCFSFAIPKDFLTEGYGGGVLGVFYYG